MTDGAACWVAIGKAKRGEVHKIHQKKKIMCFNYLQLTPVSPEVSVFHVVTTPSLLLLDSETWDLSPWRTAGPNHRGCQRNPEADRS